MQCLNSNLCPNSKARPSSKMDIEALMLTSNVTFPDRCVDDWNKKVLQQIINVRLSNISSTVYTLFQMEGIGLHAVPNTEFKLFMNLYKDCG